MYFDYSEHKPQDSGHFALTSSSPQYFILRIERFFQFLVIQEHGTSQSKFMSSKVAVSSSSQTSFFVVEVEVGDKVGDEVGDKVGDLEGTSVMGKQRFTLALNS